MKYEEKYKEALKVIESLYNIVKYQSSSDALLVSQTIEKAFPELRESEDERIRESLIKGFQHYDKECKWGEFTTTEILSWLEKQGEQKSTDKAESKFKVGDWITNGSLLVGQVTSFDGEYYHYMCEGIEQPLHISNAYNWHLWTIQDAKDILCAMVPNAHNIISPKIVEYSIMIADELIKQLKEEEEK